MTKILLAALIALQSPLALACSAFRMPESESHLLVGRNFDWDYGHGLIVINKRGVSKKAIALHSSDTAAWTSKYGSVTFNQAGRELPYGGMNEKGLMIEVLWLGYTSWPVTTAPSLNEVQWIQYQLDNRDSVSDLVTHLNDVRILSVFAKVHFFVCDASGTCATIEGMGKQMEVHSGQTLPLAALTNDTYSSSMTYATKFMTPGKSNTCANIPAGTGSLDRFTRAACASSTAVAGETTLDETARTNATLDSVAQPGYTKWQIVYDLTERSISIRTADAPVAKKVSLGAFDLSCASPVEILDLNAVVSAPFTDVSSQFTPYTREANRTIVEKSLLNGFAHLPKVLVDNVVIYPESTVCTAP